MSDLVFILSSYFMEVNGVLASNILNKNDYLKWLKNQVSDDDIEALNLLYKELDKYFAKKYCINESILYEDDIKAICDFKRRIHKDFWFKIIYRKTMAELDEAIDLYVRFLEEKNQVVQISNQMPSNNVEIETVEELENTEASSANCIESNILEYFEDTPEGASIDDVAEFFEMSKDEVKKICRANEELVLLDEVTQTYGYAPAFPVTDFELNSIRVYLREELAQRRYVIDLELKEYIDEYLAGLSNIIEGYTRYGWRESLAYFLRYEFTTKNALITKIGDNLSMTECYIEVCKNQAITSIEELNKLSRAFKLAIPLKSIMPHAIRVSNDMFFNNEKFDFDIKAIDEILISSMETDYLAIDNFEDFDALPDTGVPWNKFVLESYVAAYSEQLKLITLNYSVNTYLGAMVKRSSDIMDYEDLVYRVFHDRENKVTKETAMEYLMENHYQASNYYLKIDEILEKVNKEKDEEHAAKQEVDEVEENIDSTTVESEPVNKRIIAKVDYYQGINLNKAQPKEFVYFGVSNKYFDSWASFYVSVMKVLLDDYDYILEDLANPLVRPKDDEVYLATGYQYKTMKRPRRVTKGYYVDTGKRPDKMIESIRKLLEICLVDEENLEIYYSYVPINMISESVKNVKTDKASKSAKEIKEETSVNEPFESEEKKQSTEIDVEQDENLKKCKNILVKYFPKQFRYGSFIDKSKFEKYWNDEYGTDLPENFDIEENVSEVTIPYNSGTQKFALVPDGLMDDSEKEKLVNRVEEIFASGKNAIYYTAFYENNADLWYNTNVGNSALLREYLKYIFNKKYDCKAHYISIKGAKVDLYDEVENFMLSENAPVEITKVCEELTHMSESRVVQILRSNNEYISNGKRTYFHQKIVNFDGEMLNELSELIEHNLDSYGYMTGKELIEVINNKYKDFREEYYYISDLGLRNVIAYNLRDSFSFETKVISRKDEALSAKDIYGRYCKNRDFVTLDELKMLRTELDLVIYFETIYESKMRISKNEFVDIDESAFDVDSIDSSLETLMTKEYITFNEVNYFSTLPQTRYPWNTYLLETYVYHFSKNLKLVNNGFNEQKCLGAIVKRTSSIETYMDLIIQALTDSRIEYDLNSKEQALDYLCESGYLGMRRYGDIDTAILQAKKNRDLERTI